MKKIFFVTSFAALALCFISCGGAGGNDPGRTYAPDMGYSRAYESYGYNNVGGEYDSLTKRNIHYNGLPVNGTIARGDMMPYRLTGDSAGMLKAETTLKNPLDSGSIDIKEAERLYLIYCGICHGTKLDGNGPLFNGGNGAYSAAPRTLIDAQAKTWTDGHYFHVITFGIRQMGSYASQLKPDQRWQVIEYIRSKQSGQAGDTTKAATPMNTQPGANVDSSNIKSNSK